MEVKALVQYLEIILSEEIEAKAATENNVVVLRFRDGSVRRIVVE